MFGPRDPEPFMMIILLIVTLGLIFWRTVIKLLIVGFMTLAIFGLIELLQGLH